MYLTTKIQVTRENRMKVNTDVLEKLCYHAARLYNVALYSVRQHFFNTQSYLNSYSNYHECKDNENYHMLLVDNSMQILRNECESEGLNPDDVRALVNAPCQRLSVFAQTPSFRWG